MSVIVSRAVFIPWGLIDHEEVMEELTVKKYELGSKTPTLVPAYEEYSDYLAVPRDYGLKLIAKLGLSYKAKMATGHKVSFPRTVKHEGEWAYQDAFVKEMLAYSHTASDFIAEAATGKGKTVCALSVIQKRGRTALVIVDQENLLEQWRAQAQAVLGLGASQVGIVQGPRCDYEGKAVVIAMVQSLTQREYPAAFYDYFGTVVIDEVHTAGAPTFSTALLMFSAEVRFGVSATVDRRDALQKILHWNLGPVAVSLRDTHDSSYLYYIESDTVYSWYANISPKTGRILTEVGEDTTRNIKLAEAVQFLYTSGRDTLVISDRIEQLEDIMAMSYYAGIPREDMGLYCGFRTVWAYEKDPTPKRRPYGYVKGTAYTPVIFRAIRKKNPKKSLEVVRKTVRVIFATFGMFSKGVDEKRLNGGVDCTPRSRAQQVHGRVLRKVVGKLVPIWVTVRDVNSYRIEHQFGQRLSEYVESSAEIYKWDMTKGVRFQDVKELKREVHQNIKELKALNIIMQQDGRCTLVTPSTPPEPKGRLERPTGGSTR